MPTAPGRARRLAGGALLTAAAILAGAAPARATPFDATLSFAPYLGVGFWGKASFFGSGNAGSAGAGFTLPSGLFGGTETLHLSTTSGLTRLSFTGLGNGMGTFGAAGGKMPISGYAFAVGSLGAGPETLAWVPLGGMGFGVGVGGHVTVPGVFADFEPWVSADSVVTVPWGKNVYQYTFHQFTSNVVESRFTWTSVAGTDQRTPGGLGQVTLVSPTIVHTSLGAQGTFLVVVSLTLNFVPEPGTLLLCGAGVLALALLGEQRRRGRG